MKYYLAVDIGASSGRHIVGWMEKQFNAVLVMDGFGYEGYKEIDTSSEESIFMGLGQRALNSPMVHGAAGPAEPWINMVDRMIKEYKVDVSTRQPHIPLLPLPDR